MSFEFTLESEPGTTVRSLGEELTDGEDIAMFGGVMTEGDNGDVVTIRGPALARQSVERELPVNPGTFPQRREWGGGLSGLLFKGSTPAVRDRMEAQATGRLIANPLLAIVHEVHASLDDDGHTLLRVRADAISGGVLDETFLVKPPGVG